MEKNLRLNITLNKAKPAIWRRVLVPGGITFFDLHHIIQISMGWKNAHMFEFKVDNYKLGYPDSELEGNEDVTHASSVHLDLLLMKEGLTFSYLYDFGDYWRHTIEVEAILPADERVYPVCIDGALACPPEDIGGVPGFYENLQILNNPKHPQYKHRKKWVGRDYDPEKFDIDKVNKELPKFKKYMKNWR